MTRATSSASPRRCKGVARRAISSSASPYCAVPVVWILLPGATALTLTPRFAHSTASDLVRFSTPARAAPVCAMPGNPRYTLAITLTMRPRWRGNIARVAAACVTLYVPSRLLRTTAANPFGESVSAGEGNCPPALFTSTSTCPKRASVASSSAATSASSRISQRTASGSLPASRSARSPCESRSSERPAMTTCAPSVASSSAVARPMPLAPPVTRATWPSKSPGANMREVGGMARASKAKVSTMVQPVTRPMAAPLSLAAPAGSLKAPVGAQRTLNAVPASRFSTVSLQLALKRLSWSRSYLVGGSSCNRFATAGSFQSPGTSKSTLSVVMYGEMMLVVSPGGVLPASSGCLRSQGVPS